MSDLKPNSQIHQFKITIRGSNPTIWRRILIQESKTLADLHYVIQIVMRWTGYHLNNFSIGY